MNKENKVTSSFLPCSVHTHFNTEHPLPGISDAKHLRLSEGGPVHREELSMVHTGVFTLQQTVCTPSSDVTAHHTNTADDMKAVLASARWL